MTTKVIRGSNLIRQAKYLDLADGFADIIDPYGWNIITNESEDDVYFEVHLEMLFKIKNQEEPFEGKLTVPFVIYKTMYEVVGEDGRHVH